MTIPTVDPEFAALIPPLQANELAQLEANIVQDGCREPLSVWAGHNVLLDGHNRLTICNQHDLPFKTVEIAGLDNRDDAMLWIIANQMGRRNLPAIDMIGLQEAREPIWARKAKANMQAGGVIGSAMTNRGLPNLANLAIAPIDTRAEAAKAAGVSHGTYDAGRKVIAAVAAGALPADTIAKIRCHEESISGAAKILITRAKKEKADKIRSDIAAQMQADPGAPRITCADALDWLPKQAPCDLLLTDPPYSTDVENIDSFVEWLPLAWARVKPTGRGYVFIGAYPDEIRAYMNVCHSHDLPLAQVLTWTYRNTMGPSPKMAYFLNYQMVLYLVGPEAGPLDCELLTELCASQEASHPARSTERVYQWQKPGSLVEGYIRHSTKPGDIVIDPYAGSGTTLLAAARLGRLASGCEIKSDVVDIALSSGCVIA